MADTEVEAAAALVRAFDGLDKQVIKRLLGWAQERYITAPLDRAIEDDMARIKAEIEAVRSHAQILGVEDLQLVHAISHERRKKQLAPIGNDPDPEATEAAAHRVLAKAQARA